MAEAERDWNEFKTKVIDGIDEDDIIGQTQAKIRDFTTYYDKNTTGSIQALTNHLNDIMNEMNKKSYYWIIIGDPKLVGKKWYSNYLLYEVLDGERLNKHLFISSK